MSKLTVVEFLANLIFKKTVQKQSGIMKINPVDKVIAEKQAKSVIDKLKDKIDVNNLSKSDLNIMAEQIVHPLKHAEKVIPKESAKVLPFKYKRSFAEELADASKKGDFNRMQGIMKVDPKFKEVMKNVEKQKATEKLIRQRDLQKRPIPLDTMQYQTPEIAKLKGSERMNYLITDKDQTAKLLKKGVTSDDIIYAQDRYGMTAKDIMEASDSGFKFPFAYGGVAGMLGETDRVPYGGGGAGKPPVTFTLTGGGSTDPGGYNYGGSFGVGGNFPLMGGEVGITSDLPFGRSSDKFGVGESTLGDQGGVNVQGKWPVDFNKLLMG